MLKVDLRVKLGRVTSGAKNFLHMLKSQRKYNKTAKPLEMELVKSQTFRRWSQCSMIRLFSFRIAPFFIITIVIA